MDFTSAIKSGLSNYFKFSGRASRSEYWYFYLFYVIVYVAAGFIDGFLGIYLIQPTELSAGTGLLAGLAPLGLFIPILALTWRRLHDLDKSGALFFIGFTCIGLIPLLIWHVTKGTDGPNRFGPDPLGSGEALPDPPAPGDGPSLEA